MSMDNAFAFSKSSQGAPVSGNSANSAGDVGSSPGSYEAPNSGILFGLAALTVIILLLAGGSGGSTSTGTSNCACG